MVDLNVLVGEGVVPDIDRLAGPEVVEDASLLAAHLQMAGVEDPALRDTRAGIAEEGAQALGPDRGVHRAVEDAVGRLVAERAPHLPEGVDVVAGVGEVEGCGRVWHAAGL